MNKKKNGFTVHYGIENVDTKNSYTMVKWLHDDTIISKVFESSDIDKLRLKVLPQFRDAKLPLTIKSKQFINEVNNACQNAKLADFDVRSVTGWYGQQYISLHHTYKSEKDREVRHVLRPDEQCKKFKKPSYSNLKKN